MSTSTDQTTIERLVEEAGPLTLEESPFDDWGGRDRLENRIEKHDAVRLLWPQSSTPTGRDNSFTPGMSHEKILYHVAHDREDAVRAYIDANSSLMEHSSSWAIYSVMMRCYEDREELLEAARHVLHMEDPDGWQ